MFEVKKLINKILDFTKQETINKELVSEVDVIKSNNAVQMEDIVIPNKPDEKCENVFLSTCFEAFPTNDYMAYFKNGELFNIQPRNKKLPLYEERQIAYEARFVILDGKKYDLEDPISISNIEIPQFNKINGIPNVTFDLAYILKMRAGKEYRPWLTVPLTFKTVNLMLHSPIGWTKKDYFRLVIQLWHIGEVFYGDYLLNELEKRLPFMTDNNYYYRESFDKALENAKLFKYDYIESGHLGVTCEKCTPYQDRIYSISGKDTRFPKLPQHIIENKGLHCKISFYSTDYYRGKTITQYIYKNENDFVTKEIDALKYSNRPFIDDRNSYDKQRYDKWVDEETKRREADMLYYNREHRINEYKLHLEYHQIVMLMKDKAPKSYSGYMKMKRNNTANFQKILVLANEKGIVINEI